MKIAIVLGTRPEAIKLAPVARRFLEVPHEFETRVIVTAQHRGLLDQTLQAFAITPDYDLDVMRPGQTLAESTSRMVAALDPVLVKEAPDLVMVQGDTTTTLCGALGAFYRGLPVAHVEAGLRTGDFRQPFPEEMNRALATKLSTLHCGAIFGDGNPRGEIRSGRGRRRSPALGWYHETPKRILMGSSVTSRLIGTNSAQASFRVNNRRIGGGKGCSRLLSLRLVG